MLEAQELTKQLLGAESYIDGIAETECTLILNKEYERDPHREWKLQALVAFTSGNRLEFFQWLPKEPCDDGFEACALFSTITDAYASQTELVCIDEKDYEAELFYSSFTKPRFYP